ncbi:Mechanosensitive ion channel OS=Streptomyces tendae OX=1932 GN=GUR47_12170 PE=4 SV=1 [Streptomyces tendae]
MRERLRDLLRECPAWDGRSYNLTVTDTTPTTMEVRALVTAKDADDIWTVRVAVREGMIRWLADEHPYALPRVNTAGAAPRPSRDGFPHARRSPDTGPRRTPDGTSRHFTDRPTKRA